MKSFIEKFHHFIDSLTAYEREEYYSIFESNFSFKQKSLYMKLINGMTIVLCDEKKNPFPVPVFIPDDITGFVDALIPNKKEKFMTAESTLYMKYVEWTVQNKKEKYTIKDFYNAFMATGLFYIQKVSTTRLYVYDPIIINDIKTGKA